MWHPHLWHLQSAITSLAKTEQLQRGAAATKGGRVTVSDHHGVHYPATMHGTKDCMCACSRACDAWLQFKPPVVFGVWLIACSEVRVGPCVYRQLHWHASCNESGVYKSGPATIQEWLFAPNGTVRTTNHHRHQPH
jgi:hypothetical protein